MGARAMGSWIVCVLTLCTSWSCVFQYVVYTPRMAFMYKVDHRGEISSIQRGEKWKDILQSTVIRLGRRVARVGRWKGRRNEGTND
jgi:hypothetical protein